MVILPPPCPALHVAPCCLYATADVLLHTRVVCAFSCCCSHDAGTIFLVAAEHISMLYIGRVLLGVGVGFAIQVSLRNQQHRSSTLNGTEQYAITLPSGQQSA
jgi:hypothetical protein